ncbi:MAG: amidophosphoribosyltransferase, partial [Planctomycetota bacterium]
AKKVYLAAYSPPLVYPCPYGIDMSTRREFVAREHSIEEVAEDLGADHLIYQELDDMIAAVNHTTRRKMEYCTACFEGSYPTGDITESMLRDIERDRLQAAAKANGENVPPKKKGHVDGVSR